MCIIKNKIKSNLDKENIWKEGNYIDLGANSGDSISWFYNINISSIKYTVPYPKFDHHILNNFNTYIFEANPYLCNKIYAVVDYIKKNTRLKNFSVYCPIIVSTYDGVDIMSIDNNDVFSSKYYSPDAIRNRKRTNFTLPVLNFTNFLLNNIKLSDFNILKFDIEGEEHFIIPKLIDSMELSKFDIIYSEFHTGKVNNPLKNKALYNYYNFLNFTKSYKIDAYEEKKITKHQKEHYSDIYKELKKCRMNFFK